MIYAEERYSQERLMSLKDLPHEEWKYIENFGTYCMVSNYSRIKVNERPDGRSKNKMLPARIVPQVFNKKNGQTLAKVRYEKKLHTIVVKTEVKKYFPPEKIVIFTEKQEDIRNKVQSKYKKESGKYKTFNTFTKETRYYNDLEELNKMLGIPYNIIERVINNQIPDFMGLKIYVTDKGGKDYCGK